MELGLDTASGSGGWFPLKSSEGGKNRRGEHLGRVSFFVNAKVRGRNGPKNLGVERALSKQREGKKAPESKRGMKNVFTKIKNVVRMKERSSTASPIEKKRTLEGSVLRDSKGKRTEIKNTRKE